MKENPTLILMTKVPGFAPVKTRLKKDTNFANTLYGFFLEDIQEKLKASNIPLRIAYAPLKTPSSVLKNIFGRSLCFPQRGEDLGEKMYHAFQDIFNKGTHQVALMGGDCPDLPLEWIQNALDALNSHDMSLIAMADGGYSLIGFNQKSLIESVFQFDNWGHSQVFEQTVLKAKEAGLTVHIQKYWWDVDTQADLKSLKERNKTGWFSQSKSMLFLDNADQQ